MSFFRDPELYLVWGRTMGLKFYIFRIQKKIGCSITQQDCYNYEVLNFSQHLSLPHNKESDFANLFAYLTRHDKFVNCQGLVIDWFPPNQYNGCFTYCWSHELLNLPSYGIHAVVSHQETESAAKLAACIGERDRERAGKLALEKTVANLYEQLNREKQAFEKRLSDLQAQSNQDRQSLEQQVKDLTSKLEECCGGGSADDEEQWMSSGTVAANLFPFEELDVLTFPKNTALRITKAAATKPVVTGEDKSTNVKVSRFHGGVFPIVVVNVNELVVPDKGNARFDPDIWGVFQNGGVTYAARRPFEMEKM